VSVDVPRPRTIGDEALLETESAMMERFFAHLQDESDGNNTDHAGDTDSESNAAHNRGSDAEAETGR
jgi:hypothetical protein